MYYFIHKSKINFNEIELCSEICIGARLWSQIVNLEQPLGRTSTIFCIFLSVTCSPVFSPCSSSHCLPFFPERSLNYSSQPFSNSKFPVLYRFHCVEERASFGFSKQPLSMDAWPLLKWPLVIIAHVSESGKHYYN